MTLETDLLLQILRKLEKLEKMLQDHIAESEVCEEAMEILPQSSDIGWILPKFVPFVPPLDVVEEGDQKFMYVAGGTPWTIPN